MRPSGTLLREQDRGELACPVMQFVGRTVVAGAAAFVVVGGPGHPVDRFDHLKAWAAALATTARCSGDRSTTNRQACALAPEGAHVAASRHRMSVASSTGSSVKRRMVRAVDISSQTSLLAPVMPATYWGCFLGDAAPPLRLGALGSSCLPTGRPASVRWESPPRKMPKSSATARFVAHRRPRFGPEAGRRAPPTSTSCRRHAEFSLQNVDFERGVSRLTVVVPA